MPEDPAPRWLRVLLGAALVAGAASLLPAALHAALHCDESNVFRHVTLFDRGDFTLPGRPGLLWLLLVPLNHLPSLVASVTGYRLASVVASSLTLLLVAALAQRPRGDEPGVPRAGAWAALIGVLLLATSADWQTHAFEVRTDTYAVPLTLGAMLLLWRPEPRRRHLVLAGLLFAAAGLVSQKSVFNVVTIGAGWALYLLVAARPLRPRDRLRHLGIVAAVTVGAMAVWFVVLGLVNGQVDGVARSTVAVGLGTALRAGVSLDDKLKVLGRCLDKGRWLWVLAGLSVPASLLLRSRVPRSLAAALVAALMVGTLPIHSGFRVYYVASFTPYLALAAAGPLGLLLAWLHRRSHALVPLLLVLGLAGGAWHSGLPHRRRLLQTDNRLTLKTLRDVQELFPEPAPYWDGLGMVPGYPETTFLNTGYTRRRVRHKVGRDAYITLARQRKPRFFIRTYMSRDRYMRPHERAWHWTHFLPLRDNLYVAGARILASSSGPIEGDAEILTPGTYRVWFLGGWEGAATIDGRPVRHGQLLQLKEGPVHLRAQSTRGRGELWLILGANREPQLRRSEQQVDWSTFVLDGRSRYGQYDKNSSYADLLTPKNDPSMNPRRWATRRRRHAAWQKARQKRAGGP